MKNHVKRLHLGEELKKTAYQINKPLEMLQVTFSENGTKISSKTQLKILHFSDNISKITMIKKKY